MNKIIINENVSNNIKLTKSKSRAILLNDDKILVSNYGGIYLLPGGKVEINETPDQCIIRELKEEIGIDYSIDDLNKFLIIKYFQHNYPTRDKDIIDRAITTYYYLGEYRGINNNEVLRTENEIKDNLQFEMVGLDEFDELLKENNNNPRKKYFDRELKSVIKTLKKL